MRGNLFKTINNLSIQVNATVERFSELAKIERGLPLDTVHAAFPLEPRAYCNVG